MISSLADFFVFSDTSIYVRFVSLLILINCSACKIPVKKLKPTHHIFNTAQDKGRMDRRLKEASGLVASVRNPGMLWALNDGGNSTDIYLINDKAEIKMACAFNIRNRDWEDIAIRINPTTKVPEVIIADIGDNKAESKLKRLFKFEEPFFDEPEKAILNVDSILFELSDGPHDMEAMFVDPMTDEAILFSKREPSIGLYTMSFIKSNDAKVAKRVANLDVSYIVAGDMTLKGDEIILKNYSNIFYWKRSANRALIETMQEKPVILPYKREPQGESICFSTDAKGYYTVSEKVLFLPQRLCYYSRKGK